MRSIRPWVLAPVVVCLLALGTLHAEEPGGTPEDADGESREPDAEGAADDLRAALKESKAS